MALVSRCRSSQLSGPQVQWRIALPPVGGVNCFQSGEGAVLQVENMIQTKKNPKLVRNVAVVNSATFFVRSIFGPLEVKEANIDEKRYISCSINTCVYGTSLLWEGRIARNISPVHSKALELSFQCCHHILGTSLARALQFTEHNKIYQIPTCYNTAQARCRCHLSA